MKQANPESKDRTAMRRCAGCGENDSAVALLRFAYHPDSQQFAPDLRAKLPGRGVSVHPNSRCLGLAAGRGGFSRSLRRSVKVNASELSALAQQSYEGRVTSLLIAAQRNHLAVLGHDALSDTMGAGDVKLVVVARDAAMRSKKLGASAPRFLEFGDRQGLGRLFGREELALIGILSEGVAKEISNALACKKALAEGD